MKSGPGIPADIRQAYRLNPYPAMIMIPVFFTSSLSLVSSMLVRPSTQIERQIWSCEKTWSNRSRHRYGNPRQIGDINIRHPYNRFVCVSENLDLFKPTSWLGYRRKPHSNNCRSNGGGYALVVLENVSLLYPCFQFGLGYGF